MAYISRNHQESLIPSTPNSFHFISEVDKITREIEKFFFASSSEVESPQPYIIWLSFHQCWNFLHFLVQSSWSPVQYFLFQFAKLCPPDKTSLLKQKSSLFMATGCCLEVAKEEKNAEEKVWMIMDYFLCFSGNFRPPAIVLGKTAQSKVLVPELDLQVGDNYRNDTTEVRLQNKHWKLLT